MSSLAVYAHLLVFNVLWLLFLLTNLIFSILRNIIWLCNGTYGQIRANRKPENYPTSAQALTILAKYRVDVFIEARISDYFLLHDEFLSPEYVLRDDVTFMQITDSEAIFMQRSPECKKHPFQYPFTIIGQFEKTYRIIRMPIDSFTRLAENMESDGAKIIFLQNQSRCGGTMFTDTFKYTDHCVTFNEPHVINAACKYYYMQGHWSRDKMKRMLKNIVKVLCKPYRGFSEPVMAYVIKPTVTSIMITDLIPEILPDAVQFFIYRDQVQVSVSLRRLGQVLDTLKLMFYLPNIPRMIAPLFRFIGYCDMPFRNWTPRTSQELEFGYRVASASMSTYLRARENGVRIHGVRYGILKDHQEVMTRKIFALAGLPDELVEKAVRAFGRDSQEGTGFSRVDLHRAVPHPPVPSDDFMESARAMSREFNVPSPDEYTDKEFLVPGSIDHRT